MRHLTDGEREIVAELERDATPSPAEWLEQAWADEEEARRLDWELAGFCPSCGAPDDAPGGCRCWAARVEAIAGPADDDDLPF